MGRVPPPRMRVFAGPNGSGKTTVQQDIAGQFPPRFLGMVVNPDEIEATIRLRGGLDLGRYDVNAQGREARDALVASPFLERHGLAEPASAAQCDGQRIASAGLRINSYYASVLADFLRRKLLAASAPFSFETVMSDPGKGEFLREARDAGYRTYLYYAATEDPAIHVARVALRVAQGGHDVPTEKIVSRYSRSLALVRDAVRHADRAYFFDTSGPEALFVAESAEGRRPELRCDRLPHWFKTFVWDRV